MLVVLLYIKHIVNEMSNRKKKKEVVKLQNKTNEGLFELEDNIKRDYTKIQSVHRITSVEEAEIYKKIGYKPRLASGKQLPKTKVDEEIEVLRPVTTAEDLEDEDTSIQPTINTTNTAATKSFDNKKRDSLSGSGIG